MSARASSSSKSRPPVRRALATWNATMDSRSVQSTRGRFMKCSMSSGAWSGRSGSAGPGAVGRVPIQGGDPAGVVEGEELGDPAAGGYADDVRPGQAERVEQGGGVRDQVAQGVGRGLRVAG